MAIGEIREVSAWSDGLEVRKGLGVAETQRASVAYLCMPSEYINKN